MVFSLGLGLEAAETSPTPAPGHGPAPPGQFCAGGVGGQRGWGVMGMPLSEKIPPPRPQIAQVGAPYPLPRPPARTLRPHPLPELSFL